MCLAIWGYLALFRGGFWRLKESIASRQPAKLGIRVAAVIPARDEEDTIERVVGSLRCQRFSGELTITVADDESTDSTATRALNAGSTRIVKVPPRPSGWKGKLWAVESGIAALPDSPDFLLLTDADIQYVGADALESLIAKAEEGFDLVSVMVRLHAESIAEKMLIPAFVFFFFQIYPPSWVNSAGPTAAAAGGVMLIRPETLRRAGGIEAIHDALIDDCALARSIKKAGGRVWLGISSPEIRSIRGYGGIGGIRTMIARSAFAQLRHSFWLLIATLCGLALTYVVPVLLLFSSDWLAVPAGAAILIAMARVFYPTVRMYRAPTWIAFCLPLIAVFYAAATIESAAKYWLGSGGMWKGRVQDTRDKTS